MAKLFTHDSRPPDLWWWAGGDPAMARILDITEKNIHHHPIKRNHGFLATQPVLARLFIFPAWHCGANKGVSSATCKDLLSSLALVFTTRFSKTILELIFRKGRQSGCQACVMMTMRWWGRSDFWKLDTIRHQQSRARLRSGTQPLNLWMDKEVGFPGNLWNGTYRILSWLIYFWDKCIYFPPSF